MLTLLSIFAATLQATNLWTMRKGQVPYVRLGITYTLYTAVELWLALRDPAQRAILLFVALDIWCVGMAVVGFWHAHTGWDPDKEVKFLRVEAILEAAPPAGGFASLEKDRVWRHFRDTVFRSFDINPDEYRHWRVEVSLRSK